MLQIRLFPSVLKNNKTKMHSSLNKNPLKPSISQILHYYQQKKQKNKNLALLLNPNSEPSYQKKSLRNKKSIMKDTQIQLFKKNINKYDKLRETIKDKRKQSFRNNQYWTYKQSTTPDHQSQKILPLLTSTTSRQSSFPFNSQPGMLVSKKKYVELSAKQLMYETQSKQLSKSVENKIQSIRSRAKTQFQMHQYQGWNLP